ncbi:Piwi domain-containing protein [Phyllosticta citrichinensis]|uniref:Piwi domain-containing protein n=1 Tax=Phyllosticta citrichinensis TaxID=1130410 RepID=A0ABR1XZG6_9PEZI
MPPLPTRGPKPGQSSVSGSSGPGPNTKLINVKPDTSRQFKPPILKRPQPVAPPFTNSKVFKEPTEPVKPTGQSNALLHGTRGQKMQVTANYLTMAHQFKEIHEYALTFDAKIKDRTEKWRILEAMKSMEPFQGASDFAFETGAIWSLTPLPGMPNVDTVTNIGPVSYSSPLNGAPTTTNSVQIRYNKVLRMNEASEDILASEQPECIVRAINAFIGRKIMDFQPNDVTQIGQNRFAVDAGYMDIGGLLATRTYFLSTRPAEDRILLNINAATTAFFDPVLVSDWIEKMGAAPFNMSNREVMASLKGTNVRITYDRPAWDERIDPNTEPNRRRRLKELGAPVKSQTFHPFESAPGERAPLWQHFHATLNRFRKPHLPCANIGKPKDRSGNDDKAVWVPPEYLEIDRKEVYKGVITPEHLKNIIKVACRKPAENANLIYKEGMNLLGIRGDKALFGKIGLKLGNNLIQIEGRLLPAPKVIYAGNRPANVRNAGWNLANTKFSKPASVPGLEVMVINQQGQPPPRVNAPQLWDAMQRALSGHGMNVQRPKDNQVREIRLPSLRQDFRKELRGNSAHLARNPPRMLLVVLPSPSVDLYAALKKWADCKWGTRTVAALPKHFSKGPPHPQTLSNLAMKFNLKCGGTNQALDYKSEFRKLFTPQGMVNTLILGADVTHPGAGSCHGCPSIAAVVGSVDDQFSNMPGSMRLQASRQEDIEDMAGMAKERITAFATKNGRLPSNILMFRDGVSDGQFPIIERKEASAIRVAWDQLASEAKRNGKATVPKELKLSFYIVSKRHHSRFFASNESQIYNDKGNIKPGLVIDRVVTLPKRCNFFLQSHDALQGTAKPAHYIEIVNEIGFVADEIEQIAHGLCYTYARATKAVSYCAPAYYADRLCERGRHYLREFLIGDNYDKDGTKTEKPKERDIRLARQIQFSPFWRAWLENPAVNPELKSSRLNPWHPNLDNIMFWL